MGRKFVDCREQPSESGCTVAISADSDEEVVDAAVQHAVAVHQHEDTPELREQIRAGVKEGLRHSGKTAPRRSFGSARVGPANEAQPLAGSPCA